MIISMDFNVNKKPKNNVNQTPKDNLFNTCVF